MDLLNLIAEKELDQIISKEYGDIKPLLEKDDDDSALTTPFEYFPFLLVLFVIEKQRML